MQNISREPLKIFMHYKVIAGYMLHVKSYALMKKNSEVPCYAVTRS